MNNCPNCNKKLGIFKTGWIYRDGDKRFCSIKCKRDYQNKFVSSTSSIQNKILKQNLLNELKKKQIERETEIKISNKKPTKKDEGRLAKIHQLESELKVGLGTKLAGGGLLGGIVMVWGGIFLIIIGTLLSLTIIGAIIGIPLMIIGFIMILFCWIFPLIGIGSGATAWIINLIKKKKK